MLWVLSEDPRFPPVELGPGDAPLAIGGDLSAERLLQAYAAGIFPWYNEPPILWWSPDPRMILDPIDLYVNRSLAKALRKNPFRVSFDTDFSAVIRACAKPRRHQPDTWITADIITAYEALFTLGYAHSAECWASGELVGGLYGVAIGGAFFGESMFSTANNASKITFVQLSRYLQKRGFILIDCQVPSPHMAALGAAPVARTEFLTLLNKAVALPLPQGHWHATSEALA